ncbi:MAG: NAD+ diphosphatase [Bradymonadia bacterium]|jgi:NAD+ diphosphatase
MKPFAFCPHCATARETVDRGGAPRQGCPACSFVHWGNPTPVVAGIVETPAGVVLVQNIGWPKTWFGLVTGFLEAKERPEDGVVREVQEELGLTARIESFVGFYPFAHMNQIIMAWHLTAEGDVVLQADELQDHKIVPVDKLRPWPQATGEAVKDWLAGR